LEEVVDGRYAHSHETDIKEGQMIIKPRIPETSEGIQDEITVEQYDHMQRGLRDAGHLPVEELIRASKPGDSALEIGPGPGYFGLEWLKHTKKTHLTGLEISPAMIRMAEKNSKDYGLSDRSIYHEGNALSMPFANNTFDSAFSNGSLHEWEDPGKVFSEIFRVLKPGGELRVSDLRRDLSPEIYQFMLDSCKGPEIKKGFQTSVQAAYTKVTGYRFYLGTGYRSPIWTGCCGKKIIFLSLNQNFRFGNEVSVIIKFEINRISLIFFGHEIIFTI
jgi:ubiquinone/menaquinone biosynthesis C-methylase UbiE